MAKAKKFYLAFLTGNEPEWMSCDGQSLSKCPEPGKKDRLPVVAVLPENAFFHYAPTGLAVKNPRALKAGAKMQMAHFFPSGSKVAAQVLRPVEGRILGLFSGPRLEEIMKSHEQVLKKAVCATTIPVMAWTLAARQKLDAWIWKGQDGQACIFGPQGFTAAKLNDAEFEERKKELCQPAEAAQIDLDAICRAVSTGALPFSAIRIPFSFLDADEEINFKPLITVAAILTIIAIFAVTGEYMRARVKFQEAGQWRQAEKVLYSSVLGNDPGPDPYGRLLYRLDQIKNTNLGGVDILDLLATLSTQAPQSLKIDSMNLTEDGGIIRARIGSYADLENYLAGLEKNQAYRFTLNEATNTEGGVDLSIRVDLF